MKNLLFIALFMSNGCSISKYRTTNIDKLYDDYLAKNYSTKLFEYHSLPLCLPDNQKLSEGDIALSDMVLNKKELLRSLYFNQARLNIENHVVNTKRDVKVMATTDEILKIDTYFCFLKTWQLFEVDAYNSLYVTYVLRNP
jgi:hypothetical protein